MSKSLNDFFAAPDSHLRGIMTKASVLQSLSQRLQSLIDEPLCDHLYVANVRNHSLVIGADSAIWATRARYLAPMILKQFKQEPGLEHLNRLEFKVQPFMADKKSHHLNQLQLTSRAATSIKECAERISDPNLKRVLQKLLLQQ